MKGMTQTITEPDNLTHNLNPEQQQAVENTDGPLLVLAGAGTGKTRVLTTRIAHILLNKKAWPGEILAVTFTNKAAKEMRERVEHLTGISGGLWLGTFHSLCAKILRRHAEQLGLTSNFVIVGDDEQLLLIKQLLKENNIDDKAMPAKLVHAIIQKWKDKGITPKKLSGQDKSHLSGKGYQLYSQYQARLQQSNAVDFGDLILHTLTLFEHQPDILQEYARRFKYILVDEYQDTNVAQYLWLRLLAIGHKNICCVGDDDQSIYSWRGAEVGNILRFEKDFADATVVRLECNYRSTQHILAAASAVISHNSERLGKTLWTPVNDGEKVKIKAVWDDREEASYVGEEIDTLQRGGLKLSGMAILVRASFQTRAFEERFLTQGTPYRVIGGLRFYERAEIKDAVAYLRVVAEPRDDLAFERIINVPKRGIGQAPMQRIHSAAREHNLSLAAATAKLLSERIIKGKVADTLSALMQQFASWRDQMEHLPLGELLDHVLEESGYRAMWQQAKTADAPGRVENLKELMRAIGEFESVTAFLEHVGLVAGTQENAGDDMVSLMTLHAAKGLEFDAVFLPGWEEGLFPHQRSVDESGLKGLEEERRLAYVGITRARQKLCILHAQNRRIYNQWQSSIPSRFIEELPQEHIDRLEQTSGGMGYSAESWRKEISHVLGASSEPEGIKTGCRVFHQKFGYGVVRTVSGNHLDIAFDKAGQKKVLSDFVVAA